jgi:hypothetical protein
MVDITVIEEQNVYNNHPEFFSQIKENAKTTYASI